jgi:hypothetical protein
MPSQRRSSLRPPSRLDLYACARGSRRPPLQRIDAIGQNRLMQTARDSTLRSCRSTQRWFSRQAAHGRAQVGRRQFPSRHRGWLRSMTPAWRCAEGRPRRRPAPPFSPGARGSGAKIAPGKPHRPERNVPPSRRCVQARSATRPRGRAPRRPLAPGPANQRLTRRAKQGSNQQTDNTRAMAPEQIPGVGDAMLALGSPYSWCSGAMNGTRPLSRDRDASAGASQLGMHLSI